MPAYYCHSEQSFPRKMLGTNSSLGKEWLSQRKKVVKYTHQSTLWRDILAEDSELESYLKKKANENLPSFDCESKYVGENLFPTLIPAFQKMCAIALKHRAHCEPVGFFNFLDHLAEILWNTNKKHPQRGGSWKSIYRVNENQPFYRSRRYYDYRLFLTPDEAATIIQARVRGYQTRLKYDLVAMKVERAKIVEAAAKQKEAFNAYKDAIVNIRDCVYGEDRP